MPDEAAVGDVWRPSYASLADLVRAAELLPAVREVAGVELVQVEGPRWEIVIAPGAIQLRTTDWAKASRSREREVQRHVREVDQLADALTNGAGAGSEGESSREITGWSRRSRARMVHRLCELDYSPLLSDPTRIPAMLTLTYPGDWLPVAPNGRTVKRHLKTLRKRYERAWGPPLIGVWKLEFQRRGAPHVHLLILPPDGSVEGRVFREWISHVWAAIVGHPDAREYHKHVLAGTGLDWAHGLRSRDPKRVAVYFTKHGSYRAKDYQHQVPEPWQRPGHGPGRFWGYWGLKPARAAVHLLPAHAIQAGRTLRRWAHAQHTHRRTHTRRLRDNRGWVSCNNGASLATHLALYLQLSTGPPGRIRAAA